MPLIDLTLPAGTLPAEARREVVQGLTDAVLRAERAPDGPWAREVTWVHVHDLPADAVWAGGAPVDRPVFRVDVTLPAGAVTDPRRAELVEEVTRVLLDAQPPAERDPLRVWVLVHEVPDGRWGAGGEVITLDRLRRIATGQAAPPAAAGIAGAG